MCFLKRIFLLLSLFAICVIPPLAVKGQDYSSLRVVYYSDVDEEIKPIEGKLSDVTEVRFNPLFADFPFLRLRKGDKLVRADGTSKGQPSSSYFLLDEGRYYPLSAMEKDKTLDLWDAEKASQIFDWDFTLSNARKLVSGNMKNVLNGKQYRMISDRLRQRFPDLQVAYLPDSFVSTEEILPIPGQQIAEFRYLTYSPYGNDICLGTIKIGPRTYSHVLRLLIQGPKKVELEEFDEAAIKRYNETPVENGTFYEMPSPEVARQKRTQYQEALAFRTIVLDVIAPQRKRSPEERAMATPPSAAPEKTPAAK